MNKVILMGRLTRDPDIRYTQGEQPMAVARFNLAVDRRIKRDGEQTADFIPCVCFGRTAEFIEKWCIQGTKLVVTGRWQTGSYTNRDGQKVYTNDCCVEEAEFAESKATATENNTARPQPAPQSQPDADGFLNIPDGIAEELPFN